MGKSEVLTALNTLAQVLEAQKTLSEGGFAEAHDMAATARKLLADLIKEITDVDMKTVNKQCFVVSFVRGSETRFIEKIVKAGTYITETESKAKRFTASDAHDWVANPTIKITADVEIMVVEVDS